MSFALAEEINFFSEIEELPQSGHAGEFHPSVPREPRMKLSLPLT